MKCTKPLHIELCFFPYVFFWLSVRILTRYSTTYFSRERKRERLKKKKHHVFLRSDSSDLQFCSHNFGHAVKFEKASSSAMGESHIHSTTAAPAMNRFRSARDPKLVVNKAAGSAPCVHRCHAPASTSVAPLLMRPLLFLHGSEDATAIVSHVARPGFIEPPSQVTLVVDHPPHGKYMGRSLITTVVLEPVRVLVRSAVVSQLSLSLARRDSLGASSTMAVSLCVGQRSRPRSRAKGVRLVFPFEPQPACTSLRVITMDAETWRAHWHM